MRRLLGFGGMAVRRGSERTREQGEDVPVGFLFKRASKQKPLLRCRRGRNGESARAGSKKEKPAAPVGNALRPLSCSISYDCSELAPARFVIEIGWLLWHHRADPSATLDKKLAFFNYRNQDSTFRQALSRAASANFSRAASSGSAAMSAASSFRPVSGIARHAAGIICADMTERISSRAACA